MKDLLYDTFFCDDCGKIEDIERRIIRRWDDTNEEFFPKPKQLCYDCAIRMTGERGVKHEI